MSDFTKCDGAGFLTLAKDMGEIQTDLQDAYNKAAALMTELSTNQTAWTGETKKAFLAYLDLMLKYHGALIGENGSADPVQSAVDGLNEAAANIISYYDSSALFSSLERLS